MHGIDAPVVSKITENVNPLLSFLDHYYWRPSSGHRVAPVHSV
jgi:hypothetical protein